MYLTWAEGLREDPYQVWWVGVLGAPIGVLSYLLFRQTRASPWTRGHDVAFLAVGALGVAAEELTCLLLRVGAFDEPGNRVAQFASGFTGLYLSVVGAWVGLRWVALSPRVALIIYGFCGWFIEAFPFQKLYRSVPWPLLLGLFPPVVALHFILMTLPAFALVWRARQQDGSSDALRAAAFAAIVIAGPTLLVLAVG